jgi:hypothetical protein
MDGQLRLDVEAEAPILPVRGQLRELPGTTWQDIFGIHTPDADADAPISRSHTPEED